MLKVAVLVVAPFRSDSRASTPTLLAAHHTSNKDWQSRQITLRAARPLTVPSLPHKSSVHAVSKDSRPPMGLNFTSKLSTSTPEEGCRGLPKGCCSRGKGAQGTRFRG